MTNTERLGIYRPGELVVGLVQPIVIKMVRHIQLLGGDLSWKGALMRKQAILWLSPRLDLRGILWFICRMEFALNTKATSLQNYWTCYNMLERTRPYDLYLQPTDRRKSFYTLGALVTAQMKLDL